MRCKWAINRKRRGSNLLILLVECFQATPSVFRRMLRFLGCLWLIQKSYSSSWRMTKTNTVLCVLPDTPFLRKCMRSNPISWGLLTSAWPLMTTICSLLGSMGLSCCTRLRMTVWRWSWIKMDWVLSSWMNSWFLGRSTRRRSRRSIVWRWSTTNSYWNMKWRCICRARIEMRRWRS